MIRNKKFFIMALVFIGIDLFGSTTKTLIEELQTKKDDSSFRRILNNISSIDLFKFEDEPDCDCDCIVFSEKFNEYNQRYTKDIWLSKDVLGNPCVKLLIIKEEIISDGLVKSTSKPVKPIYNLKTFDRYKKLYDAYIAVRESQSE